MGLELTSGCTDGCCAPPARNPSGLHDFPPSLAPSSWERVSCWLLGFVVRVGFVFTPRGEARLGTWSGGSPTTAADQQHLDPLRTGDRAPLTPRPDARRQGRVSRLFSFARPQAARNSTPPNSLISVKSTSKRPGTSSSKAPRSAT